MTTIRKAMINDLEAVECLYDRMHDAKEAGLIRTNWKRGIYPSSATVLSALEQDSLFVMEVDDRLIGSAIINREQRDIYAGAPWEHIVTDDQVCVLHTMMVLPEESGKGHGGEFLVFYEQYARELGCSELRVDTSEINVPARSMYRKHGYKEIGIAPANLSGIPDIRLVMLEKYIGR